MTDIDRIRAGRSELLGRTNELANDFLDRVVDRAVAQPVEFDKLLREMRAKGLPLDGDDPKQVIERLANLADRAVVATAGPRYFGFVVGGSLPVTVAADWLTSVWDQNAAFYAHSPLAAAAEQISAEWLIELFGLAQGTSVGFVSGGTMANFTGLAAGRHALLAKLGWEVERQGLFGAPAITVVTAMNARLSFCLAANVGSGKRTSRQSSSRRRGSHETGSTSIDSGGIRLRCWFARKPETSTPARSIRLPRSPLACASTRAGFMSMAHSVCGPRLLLVIDL